METSAGAFSTVFSNFHKCRPEVAGDVLSGVEVEWVGVDVRAKFGDSRLNSDRVNRLYARPDPFLLNFVQHLSAFCSRSDMASDVIHIRQVCGLSDTRW